MNHSKDCMEIKGMFMFRYILIFLGVIVGVLLIMPIEKGASNEEIKVSIKVNVEEELGRPNY